MKLQMNMSLRIMKLKPSGRFIRFWQFPVCQTRWTWRCIFWWQLLHWRGDFHSLTRKDRGFLHGEMQIKGDLFRWPKSDLDTISSQSVLNWNFNVKSDYVLHQHWRSVCHHKEKTHFVSRTLCRTLSTECMFMYLLWCNQDNNDGVVQTFSARPVWQ